MAGAAARAASGDPPAVADGVRVAGRGSATSRRAIPRTLAGAVDPAQWARVAAIADSGLASPLTTSIGRLFDAVAALCGLRAEVNYEGQAAIELEAACDPAERGAYPMPLCIDADGLLRIDARETIAAVAADVGRGEPAAAIAARFHAALAAATVAACARAASEHGTELVVLSGGVFQNRRLLEAAAAGLASAGLRVLTPALLPADDGGISYGQAAVAAAGAAAADSGSHRRRSGRETQLCRCVSRPATRR